MFKVKHIVAATLALGLALLLSMTALAASDAKAPRISDIRIDRVGVAGNAIVKAEDMKMYLGDAVRISAKIIDESDIEEAVVTLSISPYEPPQYSDDVCENDITQPQNRAVERVLTMDYDEYQNRWYVEYSFDKFDASGIYAFDSIYATDIYGNKTCISADKSELVINRVVFYNEYEVEHPTWITFPDYKGFDEVLAEAGMDVIKDDLLRFKAKAWVRDRIGETSEDENHITEMRVEIFQKGSLSDEPFDVLKLKKNAKGYYTGSYKIDQYMPNGRYFFVLIAVDSYGNQSWIGADVSSDLSFNAFEDAYVDVINQTVDKEAPVLMNGTLKFSATGQQVVYGDTVDLSFKLKDESKITKAEVWFSDDSEFNDPYGWDAVYDERDGCYKLSFMINSNYTEGLNHFDYIYAEDACGNGQKIPVELDFHIVGKVVLTENLELNTTLIEREFDNTRTPEGEVQLDYTVSPTNVSLSDVSWESTDEKVAKVNQQGQVELVGYGECNIVLKALDGSGVKAVCKVIIKPQYVESITVKLNGEAIDKLNFPLNRKTMRSDGTIRSQKLEIIVSPDTANDKRYTVKSTNEEVFKVYRDSKRNWILQVVGIGKAQLIVTAEDDGHLTKTINIGVYKQGATSLKLAKKRVVLIRTEKDPYPKYKMKVQVVPSTVYDQRLSWYTSNRKVARVSKSGVVMGVGRGSATITVRLINSKVSTTFQVVVK